MVQRKFAIMFLHFPNTCWFIVYSFSHVPRTFHLAMLVHRFALAPAPGGAGEFHVSRALRSGAGWLNSGPGTGPFPDAPCKEYLPTFGLYLG